MKHRKLPTLKATMARAEADFKAKQWRQARAGYALALKMAPLIPEAKFGYAAASIMDHDATDALVVLYELVDEWPAKAILWEHIGHGHVELLQFAEAARAYRRAYGLWPARLSPVVQQAACACALGSVAESRSLYYQAAGMPHNSDWSECFNRSFARLVIGAWSVGWLDFEHRETSKVIKLAKPLEEAERWDGRAMTGPLVLHAEQGFGDTLMMLRYLPRVLDLVRPVVLNVHSSMHSLLAGQWDSLELQCDEAPEVAGPRMSVMSLPYLLKDPAPDPRPYLACPAARSFIADGRFLVAICWRGNPEQSADRTRSIPLAQVLEGVVRHTDRVRWISIQHQPTDEERVQLALAGVEDLSGETGGEWAKTAAILAGVDTLLTVDTGPAHLAGALGRPTLVLKSALPDWRYGLEGDESPWYASTLVLRQQRVGDWSEPFAQACQALNTAAAAHRAA